MINSSSLKKHIFYFLFIVISLSLFSSFYVDKHLSADGVYYFTWILDNCDFIRFDWSRQFADYLSQWPLVLAVKLGLTNIQILIKIFALGIYFPFLLSFLLCIYALRKEGKSILMFPLISMATICLSSDFILISESLVMATMAWPILLILLRREPFSWVDGILLCGLLFVFCRLYQTSLIPALIYMVICIVRLLYNKEIKQRIILISAILLSALIVAVSSYFIVIPRDAANATGFLLGMVASLFLSVAIIVFIIKSLAPFRTSYKHLIFTILLIIALQIFTFIILRQLIEAGISERLFGNGALSCLSFINRSLTITLLPVLLIVAALVRFFKIELDRFCILSFTLLILIMVAESMLTTYEWKNFRTQLTQIVKNGNGYIPIEETNLNNNPCRWSWNNTELGLVWAAPDIKAILLNNKHLKNNRSWQPLDPYKSLILKRYLKYKDSLCLH